MVRRRLPAALVAAGLCTIPLTGAAQETREATIVRQQAEKATRLKPPTLHPAEAILAELNDVLILNPNGLYPAFGSVYSGGGFTLGAGYRQYLGDQLNVNLAGLYSIKNYKLIELGLHSPRRRTGSFDFDLTLGWRDATQVSYHGLGIDSPAAHTTYRVQQGYAGGELSIRPWPWVRMRAGATYDAFTLLDGKGAAPDVDDLYNRVTAPGLGDSPDYVHTFTAVGVDTRPSPEYARRGGFYEIAYHRYDDRDDRYSFDRVDAEVVQHVPVLRETWVFSLRGRLQSTVSDRDTVPYFLMPSLGSGSTLRGYSSWRFRDRHAVLMSAEFRWAPNRLAMDAAIFYDAGTVADRRDALSFDTMAGNVGFGVRFHGPVNTPLRIEVAKGREGFRLVFAASAAF